MPLIDTLRNMERKFAWSFMGFLLAILFGGITLYLGFFKEVKPDLDFVIKSDSSVLDVKENVGDLDVFYEGESLSERNQDLRIISFRVTNQGNAPILSNYYDRKDPVGFEVIDGELADEPSLLSASNNYLRRKLVIKRVSSHEAVFSNVILEPNEYFEIKALVLHEVGKKPRIKSFGKIATVSSIDVLRDFSSPNKLSFFGIAFGGGIYINMVRLFWYGFVFFFIMVGLVFFSEKVSSIREKARKRRILSTFKEYESDKITEKDELFFDYYLNYDADVVSAYYSIMKSEDKIIALSVGRKAFERTQRHTVSSGKDDREMLEELKSEGFILIKDGEVEVDAQRLTVLTDFINYLKRKGEFKRSRRLYQNEISYVIAKEPMDEGEDG